MQNEQTTKGNKKQRQQKANTTATQSIAPAVQADIKTPESNNATTQPQYNAQVAEPRPFISWMQTWLPIIMTGLIFAVTSVYAYFSYGQWTSMEVFGGNQT
jgi:hypothetical protein